VKFIDEVTIYVKAGDGGRGCVSFRREKFVPRGGPNGGDGGKGGDIVVRASASVSTLLELKYRQHIKARHGGHGEGSNRTGRGSDDVEIVVPVGTLITDRDTGETLADLSEDGQRAVVARGGIGGKGNAHFATSTHQTPRFAQDGMPGEERWIHLELKLLADVGLVGLPNAGKSTFLSRVSAARPKIADYPFTTLVPQLGVVSFGDHRGFVVADIPGLIEGAHAGAGMGIQFLRHIERTGLLLHLIDISGNDDDGAPWHQYETINEELRQFNPNLGSKPQLVAIGKIDLPETRARLGKTLALFKQKGLDVMAFSSVTGEGLSALLGRIVQMLDTVRGTETAETPKTKELYS